MDADVPRGTTPVDVPDDQVIEGLEHALARARSLAEEREDTDDVFLPSVGTAVDFGDDSAEAAVDSSAVMEVLRNAIDRYTTGNTPDQGLWTGYVDEDGVETYTEPPHLHDHFGPRDRRRGVAAAVVLLFVGLIGYQLAFARGGGSSNTRTVTTPTGQAVTTVKLQVSTSVAPVTEAPVTEPPPIPAVGSAPATTARRVTPTTAAPPPPPPPPTEETTTTVEETTTTVDTTTTTPPSSETTIPDPTVPT